jgi:hypothetical protein
MRKIASLFGCLIATLALGTAQPLVIDFSNETEVNDTIALANNLGVVGVDSTNTRRMKVVRGLINPDGDNDYFRVVLAQNGNLLVPRGLHARLRADALQRQRAR